MQTTVKNLKDQRLELTIVLSGEELHKFLNLAEQRLRQEVKRPGFRPGKVPEQLAKEQLGAEAILNEGFELAIGASLADALVEQKIDALNTKELKVITNTAEELKFSVEVTPFPVVTLGEYKGLAIERKPVVVDEAELARTLDFIRRSRVERKPEDKTLIKDEELPVLDDEFARSLGRFSDLADLRRNVETGIRLEKEKKEADRFRLAVLDAISQQSKIDLPEELIEQELNHTLAELKNSLAQQGLELPFYLSKINKTEAELRKEWQPRAEKQLRHALIMRAIARQEKITLDETELETEAQRLLSEYFQNTKTVPEVDLEHFKRHLREDLLREKLLVFLEKANAKV